MLDELNEYLNSNMSDDYWYDDAILICEDILEKFTNSEWNELIKTIPNRSVGWRIRLAECLGNFCKPYNLKCIIKMINTDNKDLFVACIDTLREIDISLLNNTDKIYIINQIKLLMDGSSPLEKIVFESFLKEFE